MHVEAHYGDQRRPYLPQVNVVDGEDPEVGSPRRKPHLAPSLFYIRGVGGGLYSGKYAPNLGKGTFDPCHLRRKNKKWDKK